MNKPLRILSLVPDTGGCGWYRVKQPNNMISQYTTSEAYTVSKDDDGIAVAEALLYADIITYRSGAEPSRKPLIETAERYAQELGSNQKVHAKWVLDLDDNLELISPYSGHYYELGTQEYYDRNAKRWLFKDGLDGFDLKLNRAKVAQDVKAYKNADLVTVTTQALADYMKPYNKNVVVLPNTIDFKRWWRLPFVKHKQMRVIYSGGMSHYEDWWSIKHEINALLRKYRFTLVLVGHDFRALVDPDLRDLVEYHPWVSPESHSYHMMCMDADIAIIPLADLPFSKYKSNLKWLEFSALGLPSVVANLTPYNDDITHFDNGLLYDNPTQFRECVEKLLKSTDLRERIGNSAVNYVKKNYNAEKHAEKWVEAYQSILDKE